MTWIIRLEKEYLPSKPHEVVVEDGDEIAHDQDSSGTYRREK